MAANDLVRELERLNWILAAIGKVASVLVRAKTEREIFTGACEAATFQNAFALAWVGVPLTDTKKSVAVYTCAGKARGYLDDIDIAWADNAAGGGPTGRAIRTGESQFNNNMLTDNSFSPWLARAQQWHLQSSFALPIKSPSGQVVAVFTIYSVLPNAFGQQELELLTQLGEDISFGVDVLRTRAAYQAALQHAEREKAFSSAMMESLPGIFYFYNEQGKFLRWNKNFMRVSGYSGEEIARMQPRDFFLAEDRQALDEKVAEVFAEEESFIEAPFLAKDGSAKPYFFTGRRVMFDGAAFLVGVGIDISARKKAEMELRASEERYHSTLDSIGVGCQLIGFDWRYLYLNDAAAHNNRRPNSELLGHKMPEVWPEFETTTIFAMLTRSMEKKIALHEETEFIFPDGSKGWFDVRCEPVPEGIFILSIDISERKKTELALEEYTEQLQAMSHRLLEVQENERRLLARELHDTVGQELTALSLNLAMMNTAMPSALANTIGSRMQDSQKLLEETTQHLRNIMVELRPPGIDEFGLLAALREHAQRVAQRSGFKLVVSGIEPTPRLSRATAIALFRIAQEALNNTVKYAAATEVNIELQQVDGSIKLTIADNGKGFATARRPLSGPRGMGMTTMRERAEAIGAQLHIHSELGRGTRIVIDHALTPASTQLAT